LTARNLAKNDPGAARGGHQTLNNWWVIAPISAAATSP